MLRLKLASSRLQLLFSGRKHRADNFKLVLIMIKSNVPASQLEAALGKRLTTLKTRSQHQRNSHPKMERSKEKSKIRQFSFNFSKKDTLKFSTFTYPLRGDLSGFYSVLSQPGPADVFIKNNKCSFRFLQCEYLFFLFFFFPVALSSIYVKIHVACQDGTFISVGFWSC